MFFFQGTIFNAFAVGEMYIVYMCMYRYTYFYLYMEIIHVYSTLAIIKEVYTCTR